MSLNNYRDLSTSSSDVSAGFQFEFYCDLCGESMRTAFTPYRKGQLTGWLGRFTFLFSDLYKVNRASGAFADAGASSAKAEALEEARATVAQYYHACPTCHRAAGNECWSADLQQCRDCAAKARSGSSGGYSQSAPGEAGSACPHCQTPSQGGRFCHECGFDMASTHKSCPSCGSTMSRQARFCTDCGHGF